MSPVHSHINIRSDTSCDYKILIYYLLLSYFWLHFFFLHRFNAFYILNLKSAKCPEQEKDEGQRKAAFGGGGFPAAG